jgi:hypothetical protein
VFRDRLVIGQPWTADDLSLVLGRRPRFHAPSRARRTTPLLHPGV